MILILTGMTILLLVLIFGVFQLPTNTVEAGGNQPFVRERSIETATTMYPGRLVKKGTNINDIVVCGAGDVPIGFLGYSLTRAKDQPATKDTIYLVGARVAVISGPGTLIVGSLANGVGAVVEGDLLYCAAAGELTNVAPTTGYILPVAKCELSADSTASAVPVLVSPLF